MYSVMFSILMTLVTKRRVSRSFLAKKYEISPRTVSRYIDALIQAEVPILSSTGKNGGYYIPDEYKLDKSFFTPAEKKRLIEILSESKNAGSDKPDTVNTLLLNKIDSMSAGEKSTLNIEDGYIVIDAGPWHRPSYNNKIDAIKTAISESSRISIRYTDRHELISERTVDPYFIVLKESVWYMYGWCNERQDYRLFKLSRISRIRNTHEYFERRQDADVHEKLKGQFDFYDEIDIVIEFSSLILPQIEEWLGIEAIYEEGLSYRAQATMYSGNELLSKILSFGSSVKVISPQALKEEVLIECRRVLENT